MSISGPKAVEILETLTARVALRMKDNTDKLWCYKLKGGKHTEFAFDPRTTKGLYVRVDREPPQLPGITKIERIAGKDVSTALARVFSGGVHKANFSATVESEAALLALLAHYEAIGST